MSKIIKRNKNNRVTVNYPGDVPANKAHPAQYTITHVASGKYYIGSTGNMERRRWDQMKTLNAGCHSNPNLRELYTPGDELVFDVNPVESREAAFEAEQRLLDSKQSDPKLLNVLSDVHGFAPGHRPSPEVVAKLASKRGAEHHSTGTVFTEEHRRKIGDAHRGKVVSEETKARISASKIGQNSGSKCSLSAPVSIDGVRFETIQEAAKSVGVHESTLRRKLDRGSNPGWQRLSPKRVVESE